MVQAETLLGRPFVIIATQRTGSTLLVRSLDASPLIFCAGEIFHGGAHVLHPEWSFPLELFGSRLAAIFVNGLFERMRVANHLARFYATAGTGVRAVGFKVMASQLRDYRSVLPTLAVPGVARFFLLRQNSFATALSYFKAKASGVYHSDRANRSVPVAITADPSEFRAILDHCERQQNEVRALHATHGGKLLTYEDMTADWNRFVASIGNELGIEGLQLPTALEKLGSTPSAVRIENEDALRRDLASDRPR